MCFLILPNHLFYQYQWKTDICPKGRFCASVVDPNQLRYNRNNKSSSSTVKSVVHERFDALFHSDFICVSYTYQSQTKDASLMVLRLAFISVFRHTSQISASWRGCHAKVCEIQNIDYIKSYFGKLASRNATPTWRDQKRKFTYFAVLIYTNASTSMQTD